MCSRQVFVHYLLNTQFGGAATRALRPTAATLPASQAKGYQILFAWRRGREAHSVEWRRVSDKGLKCQTK